MKEEKGNFVYSTLENILKYNNIQDSLSLRKVEEGSYLLVCDSYNNACQIMELENQLEKFKIRFFKDSPDNIRLIYVNILEIK